MTNKVKRLYKKVMNVINNKSKTFEITKTWYVQACTAQEALEKFEQVEHIDISIKEKI